ncbi:MAG: T9SS type A sorting domain-containing protein [Ignavibacteriaceae bacterium]|nr:T9SS type A sorting domain-containing protein [Ignavibacteriaceae bacterium]
MIAGDWGVTESGWDSLLADVIEISIQMDAQWNYYDRVGLDNFSINPNSTDVEPGLFYGIASSYQLNQNYPNPFNPSTSIKYQIPELGFVALKVYDVLGNEVANLVNEYKPAGSYEIEFDAKTLPSGVYLYRLKSGAFLETKKMILMK